MFEKSIIYLLFPTIFSSIAIESTEKLTPDFDNTMTNKEIIELGVEKVKTKMEAISFSNLQAIFDESGLSGTTSSQAPETTTISTCDNVKIEDCKN